MLEIIREDDERLHLVSEEIGKHITKAQHKLISEVKKFLLSYPRAIAIAAPQVGINLSFFVARRTLSDVSVAINPRVRWTSIDEKEEILVDSNGKPLPRQTPAWEGCISFQGKEFLVTRPQVVKVEYMTEKGKMRSSVLSGLDARIFLHETDHLNGVTVDLICNASREVSEEENGMTL